MKLLSKTLLAVAVILAASVVMPAAVAAQPGAKPLLGLPEPTGRYGVGTTMLHLVDQARGDPLAPSPRARELMVQLWYPASVKGHATKAPYLPPGVSSQYTAFINAATGGAYPADLLAFPTNSRRDVPVARGTPRWPVLVFSHGYGVSAALYTALHEELASRGYVVAGIDHTFDAGAVEFPDGRVEPQRDGLVIDDVLRGVRVADTRFVLDALGTLAAGGNPDAEHRALPAGLGRALDPSRVGAFGHSLGSATVVGAMDQDRRIDAGAALDGNPIGQASLDRPFLLMGNQGHRRADDPDWAAFYDRLRGPRLHLVVDGAEHADLSDLAVFKRTVDLTAIFEVG
jgi:predicted dienelactone hydrolase